MTEPHHDYQQPDRPPRDLRVDLSGELLPSHAIAAVEALDRRAIIITPGESPAAALTAAALLVLLARTHAHIDLAHDTYLPRNPWGADTLSDLLAQLAPVRPAPRADPASHINISTGTHPGSDRYLAPATWAVAVTNDLQTHLRHLDELAAAYEDPTDAPYGGMLGAAIVAADLFCEALGPLGLPAGTRRDTFTWNVLDYTYALAPTTPHASGDINGNINGSLTGHLDDGAPVARQWPRLLFAGCGSVGSSAAAALSCDDLTGLSATTIDGDTFDPDRNTYRYPAATAPGAIAKAEWVSGILAAAGADIADFHVGPVRDWTTTQPSPGFDGTVISSVDTVDGRYEVADVLARTTLSAAVRALSFHIQREHLGDGFRCPFCDFVSTASPLAQAAADALLTGLDENRVIELTYNDTGLEQADLDHMVQAGRLTANAAAELLGRRVADLRHRLYAQAAVPAASPDAAPPAPLSAPFVSWAVGVLLAAEVAKAARGLAPVDRRVEVDLHGYPADFVHRYPADSSGRCACARTVRVRWMQRLYPHDTSTGTGTGTGENSDEAFALVTTLKETDMQMHPVTSDNVKAAGYDSATRTLRITFRSGGTYDYYNVDIALFEQMMLPHPWRRIGRLVKAHRYQRIAA